MKEVSTKKKILVILIITLILSIFLSGLLVIIWESTKVAFYSQIIDTYDGSPIENVEIKIEKYIMDDDSLFNNALPKAPEKIEYIKTIYTDSEGKFKLKMHNVKNGYYLFSIEKDGYLPDNYYTFYYRENEKYSISSDKNNGPGYLPEQIHLRSICSFSGYIRNEKGEKIPRATVAFVNKSNTGIRMIEEATMSDEKGFYNFKIALSGQYSLLVTSNHHNMMEVEGIDLKPFQQNIYNFTLDAENHYTNRINGTCYMGSPMFHYDTQEKPLLVGLFPQRPPLDTDRLINLFWVEDGYFECYVPDGYIWFYPYPMDYLFNNALQFDVRIGDDPMNDFEQNIYVEGDQEISISIFCSIPVY